MQDTRQITGRADSAANESAYKMLMFILMCLYVIFTMLNLLRKK